MHISRRAKAHLCDEVPKVLAVLVVDRRVSPLDDLPRQPIERIGVEGMVEGRHFIQHAPERPYVGFVAVLLVLEDLRAHVVRRTDARLRKVHRAVEHLEERERER